MEAIIAPICGDV